MKAIIPDYCGRYTMKATCQLKVGYRVFSLLKKIKLGISFLLLVLFSNSAMSVEISFSGFLSVVGGKVLDGSRTGVFNSPVNDVECPCVITDWNHFSMYNEKLSFNQETRAGMRVNAKLNESLTGVVQVDGRTQNNGSGSLEWAYLSYIPANDWTIQVGRKRIPIYFYSDFMDVGFAYPWVRPSQELYGWEVNNFNGFTLVKSGRISDWDTRGSLFYGREDSKDNVLSRYYYPGQHPDLTWMHIKGADLELTRDWLNIRLVYIQSMVDLSAISGPIVEGALQRIYGLSINIDYNDWLMKSEFSLFDRWRDQGYRSDAATVGVGYHAGSFTPMLTYAYFKDENSYSAPYAYDDHWALSLRYDVDSTSSVKAQYDWVRDLAPSYLTTGDAKLISVSFDKIF